MWIAETDSGFEAQPPFQTNNAKVVDKLTCKWLSDEFSAICVNSNCPACADGCPALNYQEICKYAEDKGEDNEQDN